MATSTATLTEASPTSRQVSSISSLSSSRSSQSPSIARLYKQASQLFVTRRIQEALETLEPLIRRPESTLQDEPNGHSDEETEDHTPTQEVVPIATASRGARVKVWSLYISIVNEIVEMGADMGKQIFGAPRWKHFVSMARDGGIWTDIVDTGYSSVEGEVDAEVVANLATLLLAHSPSQRLTQQRLETYLSASSTPILDVSGQLERRKSGRTSQPNGTSTPRDLNSKLKILEIYTLHVLPRNSEWEYAREFISMSEVLDEERREAFLQALQNIQDEKDFDSKREEELQKQREQQLEDARRRDEEARKAQEAKAAQEQSRQRQQRQRSQRPSENDYGVDSTRIGSQRKPPPSKANGSSQTARAATSARNPPAAKSNRHGGPARNPPPPLTILRRFTFAVQTLQNGVVSVGLAARSHPMLLFRMLAFLAALLMALSRRDIRDRLRRARDASWQKLKQTMGMGVKVSYI